MHAVLLLASLQSASHSPITIQIAAFYCCRLHQLLLLLLVASHYTHPSFYALYSVTTIFHFLFLAFLTLRCAANPQR
jgi:hypothetical protein